MYFLCCVTYANIVNSIKIHTQLKNVLFWVVGKNMSNLLTVFLFLNYFSNYTEYPLFYLFFLILWLCNANSNVIDYRTGFPYALIYQPLYLSVLASSVELTSYNDLCVVWSNLRGASAPWWNKLSRQGMKWEFCVIFSPLFHIKKSLDSGYKISQLANKLLNQLT